MNNDQKQLLKFISQVSFSLVDTGLFLDTHPCDRDALDYYQVLKKQRRDAVREYTSKYGPLLMDQVDSDSTWTWTDTPWPWECQNQ